MNAPVSILMVEDSPFDAELETAHLTAAGIEHELRRVDNREAFLQELNKATPDLILCDYSLPGFDGLAALKIAQEKSPSVPFIFVSGAMGEEVAIDSLKHGATDYVVKDRLQRLGPAVTRALNDAKHRSERARAEEELARRVRELSVLNADLEQFAYAANHDLQEPLRMISLFSKLLATKYGERLDGEASGYLLQIEAGAKRMSALVEDLLLYAKVPIHEAEKQLSDLNSVVAETLSFFKEALREHEAVVTCDPLPVIRAHPARIGLVFQNLIANALKYRGAETPRIHIGASELKESCLLWVKDNGIGFDQAYAQQVFGLFKRLNKEPGGTGLGLAICKRIIELHGGRIWAESQPNAGATFFFSLPCAEQAEMEAQSKKGIGPS